MTFLEARWRVRSFAALLDPPRQALCLRMAYGVPYPNLLSLPYFLMISFSNILILPESFLEWPLRLRHRALGAARPVWVQRVPWIFEAQDASKVPPRRELGGFWTLKRSQIGNTIVSKSDVILK